MKKEEFAKLSMALRTYYPKENLLPNNQALELWYQQLKDIPYEIAEIAVEKWVSTNRWSPTIADIRQMAAEVKNPDSMFWGDAWQKVMNAVRNYGNWKIKEALESLDDLTRAAVERIGFREICMSENIEVERANFRMIYERMAEQRKQDAQLPPKLIAAIDRVAGIEKRREDVKNDNSLPLQPEKALQ